jgi:hypothetical protein
LVIQQLIGGRRGCLKRNRTSERVN